MCEGKKGNQTNENDNVKPINSDFVTKKLFANIASIFGITNISALIIAFVYIFFVLPGEATDKALNMIESRAYEKVEIFHQKLIETYSNSLILSGENKKEIEQNVKETNKLKPLIKSLKIDIEKITQDDVLKVKDLSAQLKEGAALDRLNKVFKKVENIEENLKLEFYECKETGYINSWDKAVDYRCPKNAVIVGMYSVHNNKKEDRRFKFRYCKIRINPF